jgi:hypothetical protein
MSHPCYTDVSGLSAWPAASHGAAVSALCVRIGPDGWQAAPSSGAGWPDDDAAGMARSGPVHPVDCQRFLLPAMLPGADLACG